jgi:acetyl esterase/lipase
MRHNITRTFLPATLFFLVASVIAHKASAQQPEFIKTVFPKGTIFHSNLRYADDGSDKHLLDLYLPPHGTNATPLLVWVHGGAWREQDKYGDMNYMKNLLRTIIEKGYALASIDYRNSTTAKFPAQIQDCNRALAFLAEHAVEYTLDTA